ncbi:hypothetical protein M9458_052122 [Cirrhinus mrigala]|uniref:Uncharacterized protein n=1 Tax=Cirrhinus mrigala TaxID=683832 RepID=A0ABD0MQT1_CIRMR
MVAPRDEAPSWQGARWVASCVMHRHGIPLGEVVAPVPDDPDPEPVYVQPNQQAIQACQRAFTPYRNSRSYEIPSVYLLVELVITTCELGVFWELRLVHMTGVPADRRRLCLGADSVAIIKHNSESEDVNSSE